MFNFNPVIPKSYVNNPVISNLYSAAEFANNFTRAFVSDVASSLMEVRNIEVKFSSDLKKDLQQRNDTQQSRSDGKHVVTVGVDLSNPTLQTAIAAGVAYGAYSLLTSSSGIGPTVADAAPVPAGPFESCAEALDNSIDSCPAHDDFCKALNGLPGAPDCKVPQLQNACSTAEFEQIVERYCGDLGTMPTTTGATPTTAGPTTADPTTTGPTTSPTTSPTTADTTTADTTTAGPTTAGPTTPGPTTQDASGVNAWGIVGGVSVLGIVGVAAYCLKDRILGVWNKRTNEGTPEFAPPRARINQPVSGHTQFGAEPSDHVSNSDSDWDSFSSDVNSPAPSRSTSFGYDTPATGSNSDFDRDSFSADINRPAVSRNTSFSDDTSATVPNREPGHISPSANDEAVKSTKELSVEKNKDDPEAAGIDISSLGELEMVLAWAKYQQEKSQDRGLWNGASSPATKHRKRVSLTKDQESGLLVASPEKERRNIMEQAKAFADGKV